MDKMVKYLLISILLLPSYLLAESYSSSSHTSDLSKALCHPVRKEILEKLRSEVKSWTELFFLQWNSLIIGSITSLQNG
jgi:hypothetical protein